MEANQRTSQCIRHRSRYAVLGSKSSSTKLTLLIGTGGTLAGVGQFIKTMNEDIIVAMSDPEGSGLYNKVSSRISASSRRVILTFVIGQTRCDVRPKRK